MKKFLLHLIQELYNFGIGWLCGLLAVQLVLFFFEERGFTNLWGLWSDKMVVQESTLSIIEWLASALIGYFVMMLVNKIIKRVKLKYEENKGY